MLLLINTIKQKIFYSSIGHSVEVWVLFENIVLSRVGKGLPCPMAVWYQWCCHSHLGPTSGTHRATVPLKERIIHSVQCCRSKYFAFALAQRGLFLAQRGLFLAQRGLPLAQRGLHANVGNPQSSLCNKSHRQRWWIVCWQQTNGMNW